MNKLFLIFLLICLLFPAQGFSKDFVVVDAQRQYQLANSMFNQKDFFAAANEYLRFIYLFPHHELVTKARYNAGVSFFYAGRLEDAQKHLEKIIIGFPESECATDAVFKLSEVYLAMNKPGMAVSVLRNLVTLSIDDELRDKACFVLGWVLLDNADTLRSGSDFSISPVQDAQKYFSMISRDGMEKYRIKNSIASFDKLNWMEKKSPFMAGALSVVPGGGFAYCERYKDALASFLVNISLMLAAYESFDNDHMILGGIISFVESGFYAGNIYGAVTSAHKYNKNKEKKFIDKMKYEYNINRKKLSFQTGLMENGMVLMFQYRF